MFGKQYTHEFLTSEHKGLLDNMNHISNQLKGFYWYLLATIGSLGIAYKWALDALGTTKIEATDDTLILINKYLDLTTSSIQNTAATINTSILHTDSKLIFVLIILIIGNIILWKICEYAISHGFLYRYIQSRIAKIEFLYHNDITEYNRILPISNLKILDRDPSLKKQFFEDCSECEYKKRNCQDKDVCLKIDHLLPDQFIPIYWGCLLLISTNMCTSGFILSAYIKPEVSFIKNVFEAFLWAGAISLPFIWKILTYYLYKTNKFISNNCNLRILDSKNNQIFIINIWITYFMVLTSICVIGILVHSKFYQWEIILIPISIVAYYFIPILIAFCIFIIRNVLLIRSFGFGRIIFIEENNIKGKTNFTHNGNLIRAFFLKFESII